MSLMGTLAKVAIGIAVAKGAKSVLGGGSKGSVGDGGLFGGQHSPGGASGGLEDVMSDVFSSGGNSAGGKGGLGGILEDLQRDNSQTRDGGLDDLLGDLSGGGSSSGGQPGGSIGSLIESLAGGQAGGAGGLGGLLGGLVTAAGGAKAGDSFGNILNQSMQRRGEPEAAPSPEQDAVAGLILRAMIQAAKSDGKFDEAEQQKLMQQLGDISSEEREFVMREMQAPVDVHSLAHQVPRGMEQQVYAMSVMAIDLDNQNEAKYLHELATEFRMDKNIVNAIHAKLGAPSIYA